MKRRRLLFWAGLAITLGGLVVAARIPYFYLRSHVQGEQLLTQAKKILTEEPVVGGGGQSQGTTQNVRLGSTWTLGSIQKDTLIGGIRIPGINVEAPMLEGTDDAELDVGAGHLVTSVWPGENGTSVIAAHNATWFRHLDRVHKGDMVQVWTKQGIVTYEVTQTQVVHTGTPVPNTTAPSIVLEACYPLDALYLTPYRYLVTAKWVKADGTTETPQSTTNLHDALYHGEVPQDLIREGLTLSTNSLPMGSLQFTGTPNTSYTQSRSPLSASSTLVQLYLAWVHAASDKNTADLHALLPGPSVNRVNGNTSSRLENAQSGNPLLGASLQSILYDSRFDVTLDVAGSQLHSATGTAVFEVASKKYRVTVTALIDANQVMRLSALTIDPL